MITKDKWVTEKQVTAECEKLLAEGVALEAINPNMIVDRLKTKGRGTVYKYVDLWRGRRSEPTVLPPFALSPETTQKVVDLFTEMVGKAIIGERQGSVTRINAADQQVSRLEAREGDLLAALEATEQERDEANEKVIRLNERLTASIIAVEAQRKIAEDARAERDAIYAGYLPWLLANGHPDTK